MFKVWGKQYDRKLEALKARTEEFIVGESIKDESLEHREFADKPLSKVSEADYDEDEDKVREPSDADFRGLQWDVSDVKETTFEAYKKLIGLEQVAKNEFNDNDLAKKFRKLSNNAELLHDQLIVILSDMDDKIISKKYQKPIKEELEDTSDNMLDLAKKIKAYANHPNKDARKEDKVAAMLFEFKRSIKGLSLFAILEAIQNMDKEKYDTVKKYVDQFLN